MHFQSATESAATEYAALDEYISIWFFEKWNTKIQAEVCCSVPHLF
jgi:hypothetical protein